MIYYAASSKGFYDTTINTTVPPDAVQVPPEQRAALLQAQARGERIEPDENGYPVVVAQTVDEIKAQKWAQIKAERDRRKATGVLAGGHWFHSDDASRIQQLGLVMMGANLPAGIQWKTLTAGSAVFVEMTPTLAQQIFNATATYDQAVFAAAETHRVTMEASADPANYNFSTGWPATFE